MGSSKRHTPWVGAVARKGHGSACPDGVVIQGVAQRLALRHRHPGKRRRSKRGGCKDVVNQLVAGVSVVALPQPSSFYLVSYATKQIS